MPLSDSVDFIRWKFILCVDRCQLQCNYGIGKANSNGFINGGAWVGFSGECRKENNYYQFQNGTKILKAVELNINLLHLLNAENSLLVGNAGWSYTLNNRTPSDTDLVSITAAPTILKDSTAVEGRTPCHVPRIIVPQSLCTKLKWRLVLYANTKVNNPDRYKIIGTAWRKQGVRTGSWKIVVGRKGQTIYALNDDKGNALLYLLKLDEHILVFTDATESCLWVMKISVVL